LCSWLCGPVIEQQGGESNTQRAKHPCTQATNTCLDPSCCSPECRHWFFGADLFVDGEAMPENLMQIVKSTLKANPGTPAVEQPMFCRTVWSHQLAGCALSHSWLSVAAQLLNQTSSTSQHRRSITRSAASSTSIAHCPVHPSHCLCRQLGDWLQGQLLGHQGRPRDSAAACQPRGHQRPGTQGGCLWEGCAVSAVCCVRFKLRHCGIS
jgi:hypothetical protein